MQVLQARCRLSQAECCRISKCSSFKCLTNYKFRLFFFFHPAVITTHSTSLKGNRCFPSFTGHEVRSFCLFLVSKPHPFHSGQYCQVLPADWVLEDSSVPIMTLLCPEEARSLLDVPWKTFCTCKTQHSSNPQKIHPVLLLTFLEHAVSSSINSQFVSLLCPYPIFLMSSLPSGDGEGRDGKERELFFQLERVT